MLNPKDVRIGNLVIKITGTDRNSNSFFEYQPIELGENAISFTRICFPIKLKPDMLGSCSFRHEFGDWYKNFEVEGIEDGLPFLRYQFKNSSWYLKNQLLDVQPQYVHQLQNLYHALTHKELKMDLGFFQNIDIIGPIAFTKPTIYKDNPSQILL